MFHGTLDLLRRSRLIQSCLHVPTLRQDELPRTRTVRFDVRASANAIFPDRDSHENGIEYFSRRRTPFRSSVWHFCSASRKITIFFSHSSRLSAGSFSGFFRLE